MNGLMSLRSRPICYGFKLSTDNLKRALPKKEAQDAPNASVPTVTLMTSHKKIPCHTNDRDPVGRSSSMLVGSESRASDIGLTRRASARSRVVAWSCRSAVRLPRCCSGVVRPLFHPARSPQKGPAAQFLTSGNQDDHFSS